MKQVTSSQVLTIGYGNRKIDDFILLLIKYNTQVLVDVRSIPFSRFNPAFRKNVFRSHLNANGIDYLNLEALGGRPQNQALYTKGVLDYEKVNRSPLYQEGIETIVQLANTNIKVTLMCSEIDANNCHRKSLIAETLLSHGIQTYHIGKKGELISHSSQKIITLFD